MRIRGYNPDVEKTINAKSVNITPKEILSKMISTESNEFELAQKLLDPDCDARLEIDKYIESRLSGSDKDTVSA